MLAPVSYTHLDVYKRQLRNRDLPSLETLSRLERHDSPRRLPDGEEIERRSGEEKERQAT